MIGEIVSHYKIIEKLGGGGMGVVYKAHDLKLGRYVALKFLPPVLSMDEDYKQTIINEARIAATLDHPNICTIYDVGETVDEQIFIVMSYYDGETLKKKISQKSLLNIQIENIALQVAKGLAEAHRNNVIHRDIKPANIFLTDQNEVKILDFGIAKLAGDYSVLDAERVKGTVAYMSPEQIKGKEVDHRTDIWAFGVLLYELITGKKPFRGELEQSAIYSIINEEPDLSELNEYEFSDMKNIIQRCLNKSPENRFESFDEIILVLEKQSYPKQKQYIGKIVNWSIGVFVGIILLVVLFRFLPEFDKIFYNEENSSYRIAVLPFNNLSGLHDAEDMSPLLQSSIVENLTHYNELRIIDPNSLNSFIESSFLEDDKSGSYKYSVYNDLDISFLIDGSLTFKTNEYRVEINVIDPKNQVVEFTYSSTFSGIEDLLNISEEISLQIINYFHIKKHPTSLDKDLEPWLGSKCNNIYALKAFVLASQIVFRQEPGSKKYLERAVELDPEYISPRVWLISYHVARQNFEEAEKHYKVLKELEEKANPFDQSMISWSRAYIDNDLSKQTQALSIALDYSPNNNILKFNLGRLYYLMNDYESAIKMINETLEMKWRFSPTYTYMGLSYYKLGYYTQAKDILLHGLEMKPVHEYIYALLSVLYSLDNNYIKEKYYLDKYFQRAKKLGYYDDTIYSNLADFYSGLMLIDLAKENFHKAIEIAPDNLKYFEKLTTCYYLQGKLDSAKIGFLDILQKDSRNLNSHFYLGKIYQSENKIKRAMNHYKFYLSIDSTSVSAVDIQSQISKLSNSNALN